MAKQLAISKFLRRHPLLPDTNEVINHEERVLIEVGNQAVSGAIEIKNEKQAKKRGPYTVLSGEQRAKVGRWGAEKGVTSAVREFNVPESTARDCKRKYLAEIVNKSPDEVKQLVHGNRGRPLKLGQLDCKVQDYIRKLRFQGTPVNNTVACCVGKGIVRHYDPSLLVENGGHITIGRSWSESLLRRMGYVRRKGTRTARKLPDDFDAVKNNFLERIKDISQNVPPELVINFDQTSVKLIPASQWTLEQEGEKQIDIVKMDDKREFTALLGSTASGHLLPPQLIYSGKTDRCHPNVNFPPSWHITHSDNHWSTTETMLQYADKVLIPYVKGLRRMHNAPDLKAVVLMDVFAAHRTQVFLNKLQQCNIASIFVPAGCTGEIQPMDVAVNDQFKKSLKAKFTEYYASQIETKLNEGLEIENIKIELSTSKIKPVNARWIISVINDLKSKVDMIKSGWSRPGILDHIQDTLGVLPAVQERPGLFDVFKKN